VNIYTVFIEKETGVKMKKEKLRFNYRKQVLWISLLAVFALAACQAAPAPVAPTEVMAEAPAEAEVSVATDPALGKILVGAKGMTLYVYQR
jgi:predicted lipoprotein with Yx(FWY)xxD motif